MTANAVPFHEGSGSITIDADHTGDPFIALPRTWSYKRKKGATDVTTTATWSVINTSNCTVSISTAGVVTLTAITGNGGFTVRSVRDGVTLNTLVETVLSTAAPPATGGGASGTSSSDSSMSSTSSGTLVAISDIIEISTGPDGEVDLAAPLIFGVDADVAGSWGAELQWKGREGTSGTLSNQGAAAQETNTAYNYQDPEPGVDFWEHYFGSVTCNRTITGLTANTTHQFQLFARRRSGSTQTLNFGGTASATGS